MCPLRRGNDDQVMSYAVYSDCVVEVVPDNLRERGGECNIEDQITITKTALKICDLGARPSTIVEFIVWLDVYVLRDLMKEMRPT